MKFNAAQTATRVNCLMCD